MKFKSFLFVVCFSLFTNVFAANTHVHPKADIADKKSITKNVTYPGYCEIEIINASYTDIKVFGTFDDGASISFDIYRYESPHYISLYYANNYGDYWCHSRMYLTIQSPFYTVYSGWTNVDSTIRIVPYLKNGLKQNSKQAKAEVTTR